MSELQKLTTSPEDLLKIAEYVEATQGIFDERQNLQSQMQKIAVEREAYERMIPLVVETMSDNGIIDFHQKEAMAKTLGESPVSAIKLLVKLARRVGPVDLGSPSSRPNLTAVDEFTKFILT